LNHFIIPGHGSAGANPSNALSNTYTGMFDAMKKIVKHEGLRGLYKVILLTLFCQGT